MISAKSAMLRPWPVKAFLWRFLVLAIFFGGLVSHYSAALGDWLAPQFRAELQWLDDTYRIDRLFIDHEGADQVFRVEVGQARYIILNGRAFPPDPRGKANASTLLGNVVLPAVILLAAVLAWPIRHWRALVCRVVLLVPALGLLWASDVPVVLWGAIWSFHVDAFAPDLFSPLLIWCQFLQGGGRLALAALLACAVVALPRALGARHPRAKESGKSVARA